MSLLRPYFQKRRAAEAPKRREILAQADLDKASGKIIPRFRAEQAATDLEPAAKEALSNLEALADKAKGEEEENILDSLEAELLTAVDLRQEVKDACQALSSSRYRLPPDHIHADLQRLSTRFNTVAKMTERLRTAPGPSSSKSSGCASADGARGLKVELYISGNFSGEGEKAKREFAQWRLEWKEAEAAMKKLKGTAGDFYNRLLAALTGKAYNMAKDCGDRQDPYQEAINRLHKAYGDEVELAMEHLKPISDPEKALYAAEHAWGRFKDTEKALQQRGIELQDILWYQTAMRILPQSLEPQRRWDAWVEEQRKAFNQAQAARPEKAIKKGKSDTQPGSPLCPAPSRVPKGTPR
jgi:vacuolar-type H+-ATPase subunit I/STV1